MRNNFTKYCRLAFGAIALITSAQAQAPALRPPRSAKGLVKGGVLTSSSMLPTIVDGVPPLAGHYYSRAEFLAGTFDELNIVLTRGAQLVVELCFLAIARNGFRFDSRNSRT